MTIILYQTRYINCWLDYTNTKLDFCNKMYVVSILKVKYSGNSLREGRIRTMGMGGSTKYPKGQANLSKERLIVD